LDRLLKQRTEEAVLQQPTALKQDTKDTKRRLPLAIPTPFAASQVVRQSPDFIINTVDHRQILLSEHRGKVVALLFILTGCPHCQECVASLSKLQGEYGHQGFQALAATIDETANRDVRLFLQQVRPTFPIGFAHRSAVIQYLQHTPDRRMMMPQLVMVDRSGMIREQHSGDHPYFEHAMREKNLRASIEGLLGRR
jgi:peroxiredoxin